MTAETIAFEYYIYLIVWPIAPILLFVMYSRRGRLGGFLVYAYLISFLTLHWFGALVHVSPWYIFADSTDTIVGFRYSSYGLIALAAGTLFMSAMRFGRLPPAPPNGDVSRAEAGLADIERAGFRVFLPFGAACWIATFTPVFNIPSAEAILSVGKQSLLLGLCAMCWGAWRQGHWRRFIQWLGLSMMLPMITVATSGFIGYGVTMVTTIFCFISAFYRPRWILLVGFGAMLYGGVSLWVTYGAHRQEIRESVWGGASLESRLATILTALESLEPFDISNPDHVQLVDMRLNQNYLVGAAVRTTPDLVPFRDGETIYAAMTAVIPRAIWFNKPEFAGSGTYVSEHTLLHFAANTSVGMGQVFELYINFGADGVVGGFFLLGMTLRYLDMRLAEALTYGNWEAVMFVFFVGSGLLQAGGSLAEVAASSAAGWTIAFGLSQVVLSIKKLKGNPLSAHAQAL